MSITVQDRPLRTIDAVGEAGASVIVQATIDVPADHPDIDRVVCVNARQVVTEAAAEDGRIVVRGLTSLTVIYEAPRPAETMMEAPEEEAAEPAPTPLGHHLHCVHFEDLAPFEAIIDMPEARPGMRVRAAVMAEHVASNLVDRRRLGADVTVAVRVKVDNLVDCRVVVDVVASAPDKVQLKRERRRLQNVIGDEQQEREVEALLTLPDTKPDLDDVADLTAAVGDVVAHAEDGRVVVDGRLDLGLLYTCNMMGMMPLHQLDMPAAGRFSHAMAMPGVRAGHVVVADVAVVRVMPTLFDNRSVRSVIRLVIRVSVFEPDQMDLATDVASDTKDVDVRKQMMRMEEPIGEAARDAEVAGVLNLPPTKPPLDTMVKATAIFLPAGVTVMDGKAVVDGDLSFRLTYIGATADRPVHVVDFPKGAHVNHHVEMPALRAGMSVRAEVAVVAVDMDSVDPDTVKFRVILRIRVTGCRVEAVEVICDLVVVSPCPPGTSMRLIVVQPGDTLWKLARQYGTTIEAIARLNNIPNPDVIDVGQKLRLPCVPAGGAAVGGAARGVVGGLG